MSRIETGQDSDQEDNRPEKVLSVTRVRAPHVSRPCGHSGSQRLRCATSRSCKTSRDLPIADFQLYLCRDEGPRVVPLLRAAVSRRPKPFCLSKRLQAKRPHPNTDETSSLVCLHLFGW